MSWNDVKGSRQARGYGRVWERTRVRILKRDCRLCQCVRCKADGAVTLATEVDHVVSKARARAMGWTEARIEADSNLQAISHECHKRKTIEENGHFNTWMQDLVTWSVKQPDITSYMI